MNIFARFINSFEKPPVSKTPEEKDKDSKEWKEHSGVQAEMAEEQEKAEEERKIEQSKAEAEMKKKQEKEWEEHFGDSARILKEREEKITEPPKVPGGELLQKSEFAPGWAEQRRKIVEHEKNVLREFAGEPQEAKESTKTAPETKEKKKTSFRELLKKFEKKAKQAAEEQEIDVKIKEKPLEEQLQDLLGNPPVHKESVKNEPEAGAEKRRLTIEELKNKTKEELQELRNKASYEWANAYLKYEKVLSENPDVVKARQAVEKASGTDEWDSAYKTANKIEEEFVSKNPKIAKLKEEYDAIGDYVRSIDTAESKLQEQELKNN